MAEEIASPAESPMDYREHDRTYEGFLALTKIGILHVITILLALAMFGFGGSWGFTFGVLTILLAIIAAMAIRSLSLSRGPRCTCEPPENDQQDQTLGKKRRGMPMASCNAKRAATRRARKPAGSTASQRTTTIFGSGALAAAGASPKASRIVSSWVAAFSPT